MCKDYRKQYRMIQKERDSLYESYALGRIGVQEYRSRADRLTIQIEELEELTQEVMDTFIKRIEVYKNRRVEIAREFME